MIADRQTWAYRYCRKLDMLNSDLCMSNEAQSKRNGKTKTAKSKRNAEEVSYHFNAFMPIKNELWRLDGLERHPQNLGAFLTNFAFVPWLVNVGRECF